MGGWTVDVTGALSVTDEDGLGIELRPKERAIVAAVTLLHPQPATVADLVELIWADPPDTARKAIHNHVARLRRTADGLIETGDDGYRLGDATAIVPPSSDDVFHDLVEHTEVAVARTRFRDARLLGEEELALRRLGPQPDDDLIDWLADLAGAEPHRMDRWRLLVVGLARRGRRRDALDALRTARREAAMSSGDQAELDRLERAVFDDDPRLGVDTFLQPMSMPGADIGGSDGHDGYGEELFIDPGGTVDRVIEQVGGAAGSCIVVAGPAGSGKSTLCRQARSRAAERGWETHQVEARSHGSADADVIDALVRSMLDRRRSPIDEPVSGAAGSGQRIADSLDRCLHLLIADGRRRLVIVDDLHHASQDEVRSIASLVTCTAEHEQVLWLIASRRDPELPGEHLVTMTPWDASAVAQLLHRFVPPSRWTEGAAQWIAEVGRGNALAIRELAIDCVRRRQPTTGEDGEFVAPAEHGAPVEWVRRRVDALDAPTRHALTGAAMVGVEFGLSTLAAFTDDSVGAATQARLDGVVTVEPHERQRFRFAHDLFRDVLLDDADDDTKRDLALVALRDPMFDDDTESRRRAQLARLAVRDDPARAVEETIAAGRLEYERRHPVEAERLFRRAVELMDRQAERDVPVDELLRTEVSVELGSLALSNGRDDAIGILLQAADRACRFGRSDLAVGAVYEASRVGPGSTVGRTDTDIADAISRCRRLELAPAEQTRLEIAEMSIYGIGTDGRRARELLDSALASARASGDTELLDVVHRSAFMSVLRPDDLPRRRSIAEHLHERGRVTGDLTLTYEASRLDFSVAVEAGERDPRPILTDLERMHAQFGERSRNWSLFAFQTVVAWLDGDQDRVQEGIDRILSPETVVSPALKLSTAGGHQLGLHLLRGDVEVLDPLIAQIEESTPGLPAWVAARSLTAAAAGDLDTATERLERAYRPGRTGGRLDVPDDFTGLPAAFLLGETARITGHTDALRAAIATLSPHKGLWLWHGTGTFGPVDLVLARWARTSGEHDDAERLARSALSSANVVGAPHVIADAATLLAEVATDEERVA